MTPHLSLHPFTTRQHYRKPRVHGAGVKPVKHYRITNDRGTIPPFFRPRGPVRTYTQSSRRIFLGSKCRPRGLYDD